MNLNNRVVVITGGAGALGHVVVPTLAEAGARVITADRQPPRDLSQGVRGIEADVTDENGLRRVVDQVLHEEGRIDGLINLIGGFAMGSVAETEVALWQRMLSVNLTTAFLLSKAVLPLMAQNRGGRILHIAARAALEPFPGAAAYLVAKSGLVALIRVLALELAGSGVTINGLLPSTIDTPANRKSMPDADPSKWVKPESIARLLVFLVSEQAGQINGALIPIG